jgi:hypothetical protein
MDHQSFEYLIDVNETCRVQCDHRVEKLEPDKLEINSKTKFII